MASQKALFAFLMLCIVVIVLFMSDQTHASPGDGDEFRVESGDDSKKVKLSLYYEALCPFCANFIVNNLAKIFENGLASIISLKLVPWGNTYLKDKNHWICQHGPDECMLNTVEACAIRAWPDLGAHFSFRFIKCVERLHMQNKHNEWQSCFGAEGLDSKPIVDCYNSGLGFQLERSYADETARLNPPHRFVPWVVVDGLPLEDDYQNFMAHVCRAYRGSSKPKACQSASVKINTSQSLNSYGQVCYPSETKSLTTMEPAKRKPDSHMVSPTRPRKTKISA